VPDAARPRRPAAALSILWSHRDISEAICWRRGRRVRSQRSLMAVAATSAVASSLHRLFEIRFIMARSAHWRPGMLYGILKQRVGLAKTGWHFQRVLEDRVPAARLTRGQRTVFPMSGPPARQVGQTRFPCGDHDSWPRYRPSALQLGCSGARAHPCCVVPPSWRSCGLDVQSPLAHGVAARFAKW